jgi:hypothetical protein
MFPFNSVCAFRGFGRDESLRQNDLLIRRERRAAVNRRTVIVEDLIEQNLLHLGKAFKLGVPAGSVSSRRGRSGKNQSGKEQQHAFHEFSVLKNLKKPKREGRNRVGKSVFLFLIFDFFSKLF